MNKINICFGSSCFCRGNNEHLETVEKFISTNKLEEKIDFRGTSCEGKCSKGPIISINEKKYYELEQGVLFDLLNELKEMCQ